MFRLAFLDFAYFDRPRPSRRPLLLASLLHRTLDLLVVLVVLLVALLVATAPARAAQCNTIFLTDKNGNISFPLCPPNRANSTPGFMDNMTIGASVPAPGTFTNLQASSFTNSNPTPLVQGTPVAHNTAATLAAADLSTGIITSGPAASIALTLPLATAMDTAFPNAVANSSLDFSVVNTSTTAGNSDVMTINTGWTLVGNMVVPGLTAGPGTSGRFRATKTGAGAWTLYRLT